MSGGPRTNFHNAFTESILSPPGRERGECQQPLTPGGPSLPTLDTGFLLSGRPPFPSRRAFAGGLGHQGTKDTPIVLGLQLPLAQESAGDPEGQLSVGLGHQRAQDGDLALGLRVCR